MIRKFIVLSIVCMVILLTSCGRVNVSEKVYDEKTDTYTIHVVTSVFEGLSDEVFQNDINNAISADNEELIKNFKTGVSTDDEAVDELTIEPTVYFGKNTISVVSDIYEYNGGNHGIKTRNNITVDTAENKQLVLDDLFIDDKWHDFVNSKLENMAQTNTEEYSVLWEKPTIGDNQGFYLDNASLVIYYPPYELSYYARGFVEFKIPLAELTGYIKPMYVAVE